MLKYEYGPSVGLGISKFIWQP